MNYKEFLVSNSSIKKMTDDIYFDIGTDEYCRFDLEGHLLFSSPSFIEVSDYVPPSTASVEEENTRWLRTLSLKAEEALNEVEEEDNIEEVQDLIDQAVDRDLDQMYGYFNEPLDDEVDYEDETEEYLYEHTLMIDPNWTLHELALHLGDSVRASIILWGNLQENGDPH